MGTSGSKKKGCPSAGSLRTSVGELVTDAEQMCNDFAQAISSVFVAEDPTYPLPHQVHD